MVLAKVAFCQRNDCFGEMKHLFKTLVPKKLRCGGQCASELIQGDQATSLSLAIIPFGQACRFVNFCAFERVIVDLRPLKIETAQIMAGKAQATQITIPKVHNRIKPRCLSPIANLSSIALENPISGAQIDREIIRANWCKSTEYFVRVSHLHVVPSSDRKLQSSRREAYRCRLNLVRVRNLCKQRRPQDGLSSFRCPLSVV